MLPHRLARLVSSARVALLALVAVAALPTAAEASAESPIRLLAPDSGAVLEAGGTAELAWEPLASFANIEDVEEWEAFLSLDGGATYPFRLTPHLDQDVRRFRWRIPAVPSADARLLFRFGDERRETAVALPQRFVIRGPEVPAPLGDETFALSHGSSRLVGEPALPGQRGVVAWVEGSRRGSGLHQVVGFAGEEMAPTQALPELPLCTDLEGAEEEPLDAAAAARVATSEEPPADRSGDAPALAPPRPCSDILLLTHRQNE